MQRRLFRIAVGTAIACVVLAPALIGNGQRSQPANSVAGEDFVFPKEPPVFTVGPPMTAEALAARETEKRLSLAEAEARAREYVVGSNAGNRPPQVPEDRTPAGGAGVPSLTPTELQKLTAIRRGASEPREDRSAWPKKREPKPEKIHIPLRPLGAEGLTPGERAKLEASRALQDGARRDDGGRSR